jgi:hypothetical protein
MSGGPTVQVWQLERTDYRVLLLVLALPFVVAAPQLIGIIIAG